MSAHIVAVHGRRVWDSRGRPTVEVEVRLQLLFQPLGVRARCDV